MSMCSSPASHRSSYSECSSTGPLSPHTAVTTPAGSCNGLDTPKFGVSFGVSPDTLSPQDHAYMNLQPPSPLLSGTMSAPGTTPMESPGYSPYITPLSPNEQAYYQPYSYSQTSPTSPTAYGSTKSVQPRYSGYPPASAFYGPAPGESSYPPSLSFSNTASSQYSSPNPPINPSEYKMEDWYTADGQKVEYSAMSLHCATM